jgi:uncharacterized protein (TIGR03083 family)
VDARRLAREERADFAAFLGTLSAQQWHAPTLCARWRVRDVVAHVISYDDLDMRGLLACVIQGRFHPDQEWVKQSGRDAGTRQDGGLTSDERRELVQLRGENRRLREDVDVRKRATAFFCVYVSIRWPERLGATIRSPGGLARFFAAQLLLWLSSLCRRQARAPVGVT